jgi:hypothetical protein
MTMYPSMSPSPGYYNPYNPYVAPASSPPDPNVPPPDPTVTISPSTIPDPVGNPGYSYGDCGSEYSTYGSSYGSAPVTEKTESDEDIAKRKKEKLDALLEKMYDLVNKRSKTEDDTRELEKMRAEYEEMTGQKKPGFMP